MRLVPGTRLDRYTLVAPLGEGGQASVWRAEDPLNPGQPLAVKLISLLHTSGSAIERLRREARQLVRLKHPSLVQSQALFEDLHSDMMGLVMELVEGEDLHSALERGALSPEEKWWLLKHLACVLSFIHEQQVIHRDIKPQNILIYKGFLAAPRDANHIKLVDFGIAVPAEQQERLTALGHVVGTLPYLAPELLEPNYWRNQPGPAQDVFAFGVLAWSLFLEGHPAGVSAHAGITDYAIAYRQASHTLNFSGVKMSRTLRLLLSQALEVDSARRAPNGGALLQLLKGAPGELALEPWQVADGVAGSASQQRTSQPELPPTIQMAHGNTLGDPRVFLGVGVKSAPPWAEPSPHQSPTSLQETTSSQQVLGAPASLLQRK